MGRPSIEHLALIYESVAESIILFAVEAPDAMRVVSVNPAVARIMGTSVDALVGLRIEELGTRRPEENGYVQAAWRAVRTRERVRYTERTTFRGRRFVAEITLTPIRTGDVVTNVLSVARDITEEALVLEEHAKLSAIVEATRDFVGIATLDHKLSYVNPAGRALVGLAPDVDVATVPVTDIFPVERNASAGSGRANLPVDGQWVGESWLKHTKTGEKIPVEANTFLLTDPQSGTPIAVASVRRDIRERLVAEELRRQSEVLVEQNRLIQAANRMKSEFVANMSHELRTPLNAIVGFAELLHDDKVGPVSDAQRACLADILTSGRHLLELINGMLDLAKIESGRMELHTVDVDLPALIVEAVDALQPLAARKRIHLVVDLERCPPRATVDAGRMMQVLFNYLSNAIKFTHEGGRVTVRALPVGADRFRLVVEDTGVGIRADDLPKLFQEFSQLDTGLTRRHEGTGLGLMLTKRIVEAMGGEVGVDSTLGKGSAFFALLPLVWSARG
jgi:PAS domain S-box-containing protein